MRALTFITLGHAILMVYSAVTSKAPPATTSTPTTDLPFSVDCPTKSLTLKNNDQTIVGAGGCNVKGAKGSTRFTLDDACLSNGTITLEKTNTRNAIVTAVATYRVTCEEDRGVVLVVNYTHVQVDGQTGTPVTEAFSVAPTVDASTIHLDLSSTDPSTGNLADIKQVNTAYLGEDLYLSLFSNKTNTGLMNVIPLFCEATMGQNTNATLWQLHNSPTHPKDCYRETQVMSEVFAQNSTTDGAHIYVAKIQAFRFQSNQAAEITFSCKVRVCSTETGFCETEKLAVDDCKSGSGSGTGTRKPSSRRRRDADDSEFGQGKLDQVSAKLRVVDKVVTYAGATRATFTVTSLVMVAVAMVIL